MLIVVWFAVGCKGRAFFDLRNQSYIYETYCVDGRRIAVPFLIVITIHLLKWDAVPI